MIDITKYIDPRNWLWWVLGAIAVVAGLWFGVISPYNDYVSGKKVAAALEKERAITETILKELTTNFKTLQGTFENITAASNAERAKRKAEIDLKTKDLQNALAQNQTLKTDLANLRGADAEFNRVLNTITANNHSATGASASARLIKLGSAYSQCEKEFRESRIEHADTLGRLDEALKVVRALKN
jgi:hypothetical protein